MEPNQISPEQKGPDKKTILAVLAVLVILTIAYLVATKYDAKKELEDAQRASETKPLDVVVEHTQRVNGALPVPPNFPADIPVEKTDIIESATTEYPTLDAKQLSLNYMTSKTVAQKLAEYKDYMTKAGYTLTEGDPSSPVKALFGTKEDANLSVVISSQNGKTLVQVAYLLK